MHFGDPGDTELTVALYAEFFVVFGYRGFFAHCWFTFLRMRNIFGGGSNVDLIYIDFLNDRISLMILMFLFLNVEHFKVTLMFQNLICPVTVLLTRGRELW